MIQRIPNPVWLVWVVAAIFWAAAPAVAAPESPEEIRTTEVRFHRIAVAPILVGHRQPNMDERLDDTLSCPINQICVDDPTIDPDAGPTILRLVQEALEKRFGRHVVSLAQVEDAYTDIRLNNAEDSPRTLARQLGQNLSADLVLVGTVWRFRERGAIQGFPDKPASVAFALYLVASESGRRLWRGVFDETQEFALKDMARFGDRIQLGLTWLSAKELARHGVQQALKPFPTNIRPVSNEEKRQEEGR